MSKKRGLAPTRILHIVGRMDRAGAETLLMNLYREMDRCRFQFDFVYFTDSRCDYDEEVESLGGRIVRIRGHNPVTRFLGLWWVLRQGEWSIVHAHTLFSNGLHLLSARLACVPRRVAHSHNTNDANDHSLAGRVYQCYARWLLSWVPTDYLACGAAAADYLFPSRRDVRILPNSIDVQRFLDASGIACRRALGAEPGSLVVLQVGRLMSVKNHAWSVQIATALQDAGVDFRLLFVGIGPERPSIESLIRQEGLEERVQLWGLREDIPELMAGADVMLMPSLYEGFPVALVESQAAGLPAVLSSTISPEVDMGLGLVQFVDLSASPQQWVDAILRAAGEQVPPDDVRCRVLQDHGFSSEAGARLLESIYGTS